MKEFNRNKKRCLGTAFKSVTFSYERSQAFLGVRKMRVPMQGLIPPNINRILNNKEIVIEKVNKNYQKI
jgi:hypothetical protein